jgi:hypothetical protein
MGHNLPRALDTELSSCGVRDQVISWLFSNLLAPWAWAQWYPSRFLLMGAR